MPSKRPVRIKPFLSRHITPERTFILGFAACILLGTWLLSFPFSAAKGRLGFVDALFTATSAVCVTGLATIDIGKDLSLAGQIITILLFQVGGLGIITFSTVFFVLMGRGISFRGREIVQSTFLHTPRGTSWSSSNPFCGSQSSLNPSGFCSSGSGSPGTSPRGRPSTGPSTIRSPHSTTAAIPFSPTASSDTRETSS